MAPIRVFYSWSNDNDPRACRNFVQEALKKVCNELTVGLDVAGRPVELDHDTKGETGSPSITDTIERKIRECNAFVADLTPAHVQVDKDGYARIAPNPNVMYELGYAYRSIGADRIVTVMNTAFAGSARKDERRIMDGTLPFNLRHRSYPECYELFEDSDSQTLRGERSLLVRRLGKKLKPIVERGAIDEPANFRPQQPLSGRVATFLEDGEVLLDSLGGIKWQDTLQHVYVRFVPDKDNQLTNLRLEQIVKGKGLVNTPPFAGSSGDFGLNKYGYVVCSIRALPNDVVLSRDMIQYFKSGEIWGVFGSLLLRDSDLSYRAEELFAWVAERIVEFVEAAGLRGAGRLEFGIVGLEDRKFLYPGGARPFLSNEFKYEQAVESCSRAIFRQAVESASINFWAEAGVERPQELAISL